LRSLQAHTLRDFETLVVDNTADLAIERKVAGFNQRVETSICCLAHVIQDGSKPMLIRAVMAQRFGDSWPLSGVLSSLTHFLDPSR
jgi:hypothetical protein